MSDGQANGLQSFAIEAMEYLKAIEPGARNVTIYFALNRSCPAAVDEAKGLWSAQLYLYGFYDESLFKATVYYTPFANSKTRRYRAALCTDEAMVQRHNPITTKFCLCGCPSCLPPLCDFKNCKVKCPTGGVAVYYCPAMKQTTPAVTRTASLEEFAIGLHAGEFRAVRVAEDEEHIEGTFWIAELFSDAYKTEEEVVVAGETIPAGFWVVKIKWLEFLLTETEATGGRRLYKRLNDERLLSVSALMRIKKVKMTILTGRLSNRFALDKADELIVEHSL